MDGKPIFLIGFMGSGKTTWGKKLAKHLGRKFIDLDHVLTERMGMSIPEYFQQFGEAKFREEESRVLREIREQDAVISTGGGTPCHFDNMEWIKSCGIVVYLQLTADALFARLQKSDVGKRPALKGFTGDGLRAFIEDKLAEREPFYRRAHIMVHAANVPLEEIRARIDKHLEAAKIHPENNTTFDRPWHTNS